MSIWQHGSYIIHISLTYGRIDMVEKDACHNLAENGE